MSKYRVLSLLLLLLLATGQSLARETIREFHSAVEVRPSGDLVVTETIRVRAEGDQIKRGIYRDFPTDYRDRFGNRYRVGFELLGVQRDGRTESYHTELQSNGIRIYMGSSDYFLPTGEYSYTLRYRTTRQLGFFEDHDELYWNVTGNGWAFPIEWAGATVTLPASIPPDTIGAEAYTGLEGAQGTDYRSDVASDGSVTVETTRALRSREGLTLVVTWPKGYVVEPTREQRMTWLLADNRELLAGGIGLFLLLLYYLWVWLRVGRDPKAGIIVPLYQPPKPHSPASMRFVRRMGYDDKAFAAAVVSLAVKGYLHIEEDEKGTFTLLKTGNNDAQVAAGEGAVASALFGDGRTSIMLKQSNHPIIGKALKAHKRSLQADYEKAYFQTNSGYLLPGILLTVIVLAVTVLQLPSEEQQALAGFLSIWLSLWTIGVVLLLSAAIKAWRAVHDAASAAPAVGATVFALPFTAAEIGVLWAIAFQGSMAYALTLITALLINILFYQWLKAPTLAGRRLLDQIEGFRQYLSVAEGDELRFKTPLEKTPELFERYLPYALALDVEQEWGERFNDVLQQAQAGDGSYHPAWYQGRSWHPGNLTGFTGAMGGAVSSAISASSTAPGSSSGSGGGGSSGGGGGGGGGGGW
jgi:hypothetical protein